MYMYVNVHAALLDTGSMLRLSWCHSSLISLIVTYMCIYMHTFSVVICTCCANPQVASVCVSFPVSVVNFSFKT